MNMFTAAEKFAGLAGRQLVRVGIAGSDELELVFARYPGESAEKLVTLPLKAVPLLGEIDLNRVESTFGGRYGLGGEDEIEGVRV